MNFFGVGGGFSWGVLGKIIQPLNFFSLKFI